MNPVSHIGARFGFAWDETGRLRVVRTYKDRELRVMDVPETWTLKFMDEPPDEMVEAAAKALWEAGNARVGYRPFGMVAETYRDEGRSALIAALETQTSVQG